MPDFATDVSAWCTRQVALANQVLRATAFDFVAAVQAKTPVDTGFLRSNWTAMVQGDEEPVAGRVPPAGVAILKASVGVVIVIVNPVVYARRIEYGFVGEDSLGRHYNQQGRHMVAATIAEAPQIAEAAYQRIAAGGTP